MSRPRVHTQERNRTRGPTRTDTKDRTMTDTPAPSSETDEAIPVAEFEHSGNSRLGASRTRRVVTAAVLTSMLAGAGAVAIIASNSDGDSKSPSKKEARKLAKLRLRSGAATTANQLGAGQDESLKRSAMPYQNFKYNHTGAWPNLAKNATVYKINATRVDQAMAQRITDAVGIKGSVKREQQGWGTHDANLSISIMESPGSGTSVSVYKYFDEGDLVKPGVVGSSAGEVPDATEPHVSEPHVSEPDRPVTSPDRFEQPPAPKHLPSEAEASRIAQALLTSMGVDETFEIEVVDGSSFATAVACPANVDCPEPAIAPQVLYGRTVMFHRVVDGHRVNGLDWSVEVGDNGAISSVFGMMADLEVVDTYPLRPVDAVYDDLKNGTAMFGGGVIAMDAKGAAELQVGAPESQSSAGDAGEAPPTTGGPAVEGPAVEGPLVDPNTGPIDIPVQQVNVTTASVGYQLWYGTDAGADTEYIVPTYTFSGTVSGDYEGPWSTDVIALDKSFIDAPQTPEPAPVPVGRGDDDIKGDGSQGIDGTATTVVAVEEPVVIPTTPPSGISEPTPTEPVDTTVPAVAAP